MAEKKEKDNSGAKIGAAIGGVAAGSSAVTSLKLRRGSKAHKHRLNVLARHFKRYNPGQKTSKKWVQKRLRRDSARHLGHSIVGGTVLGATAGAGIDYYKRKKQQKNMREEVMQDVLERLHEEYGNEALQIPWSLIETLVKVDG